LLVKLAHQVKTPPQTRRKVKNWKELGLDAAIAKTVRTFDVLVFERVPYLAFFVKAVLSSTLHVFGGLVLANDGLIVFGKGLRAAPFAGRPGGHHE
jgi:hypothetical protein